MEFKVIVDKECKESVVVTVHKKTSIVDQIQKLVENATSEAFITCYANEEVINVNNKDITCFFTKDAKVYAYVNDQILYVRQRLYQLEQMLDDSFIKLNQGCIANISQIKSFSTSLGASIKVNFKNGYFDYVSRRELKNVKRRLGLWKHQ